MAIGMVSAQETNTIDDENPFREFPVTVDEDGTTTLTIDVVKKDGDLDTLLYLLDAQGNIIAENDDRESGVTDSRIVFPSAPAGDYIVVVTRYKVTEGKTSGTFELNIDITPFSGAVDAYDVSDETLAALGFPMQTPQPPATWTVLAYFGADTNLEPGILNDFDEFEQAGGSNEQVRVIALVDRTPEYTDVDGDWSDVRLYEIGEDGDTEALIDTEPLAIIDELDTGDGQTLAQFLTWAIKHYPAENYAVAFGSHGAGWQGLITDDTSDKTIITLPELERAFTAVTDATGIIQFDFLINDACLMSSVEYYTVMDDFFALSVASPEIVVNPALDMALFLNALRENRDLVTLGTELVDVYMERDVAARTASDATYLNHAVTDLNSFAPVVTAVDAFAQIFMQDPVRYASVLGEARANAYAYSAFWGNSSRVDLGSLMQQVVILSDDAALDSAAQAVINVLDTTRLHARGGDNVPMQVGYYNIYFPQESAKFESDYIIETPLKSWGEMLRIFYSTVTPQVWNYAPLATMAEAEAEPRRRLTFHAPRPPQVNLVSAFPETASLLRPVNIQMETVGRNIARAELTTDFIQADGSKIRYEIASLYTDVVIDGELYSLNIWSAGAEPSTTIWSPYLLTLTDGTQDNIEFFVLTENTAAVNGRYRLSDQSEWNDVTVIFDLETGELSNVISQNNSNSAVAVVMLPPGVEFQTYQEVVTPDGRTMRTPANTYAWDETALTISSVPAPTGQYELGFLVETYGGTSGFDSIAINVDNTGVDTDLQGYLDVDLGISIVYPFDFDELIYNDFEQWWITGNEDIYLQIYDAAFYALDDTRDIELAINAVVDDRELNLTDTAFTDVVVDGEAGLAFSYTEAFDGVTADGRGFAVYNDFIESVLIFTTATVEADTAVRDQVFDLLVEQTLLLNVPDARAWSYDAYYDEDVDADVIWPMLREWLPGEEADDGQVRYTPPTDDPGVFFSVDFWTVDPATPPVELLQSHVDLYYDAARLEREIMATQVYYSQYADWDVEQYTYMADDQAMIGRLYATVIENVGYTLWMEAPADRAGTIFIDNYEPIVDGFRLETDNNPYADAVFLTAEDDDTTEESSVLSEALGFVLPLPENWYPFESDDGFFYTTDLNEETYIYAFLLTDTDDPTEAIKFVLDDWGENTTQPPQPITVDGREGFEIAYAYTDQFGAFDGWVMLFPQDGGFIMVMIEQLDASFDAELYASFKDNLNFSE
jgi:hypothetical protein